MKKLFVGMFAVTLILGACSAPEETSSSSEPAKVEKKEEKKEKPKQEAKAADLGSGTFYVGEDIVAGRYVVSTEEDMGNFNIFPKKALDMGTVEILGADESVAVNNITVDLKDGDEIEIGGLNKVHFEPK